MRWYRTYLGCLTAELMEHPEEGAMVGLVANKTSKPAFFDLIHRKPPSLIIGPIGVGFNLLKRSKLTVWIELFAPSFERSPGLSNDLFARGRHVRRSDTSLIAFSIRSAQRSSMPIELMLPRVPLGKGSPDDSAISASLRLERTKPRCNLSVYGVT